MVILFYKQNNITMEDAMFNKTALQDVLIDQWEIVTEQEILPRKLGWEKKLNYCLVGIRRAGKSCILVQRMQELLHQGIPEDAILYVNFEDERLLEMQAEDLNLLLEVQAEWAPNHKVQYVFLDEIQNVPGWEKFVRRLADSRYRVYVTGSNAKMLSREIATTLGGRFMIQEVYPYGFQEFLLASGVSKNLAGRLTTKEKAIVSQLFSSYLMEGAFPELIHLHAKRLYLNNIYQTIYLGDIIARNQITGEFAVRLVLKKMAETVCRPISYSRLTGIVKASGLTIAKTTVIRYIACMIDAYLIFPVYNYQGKLVEKETNPKYYFMDTGILNLLLVDGKSQALENLVAIELLRRFGREQVFFYEKNVEVDFYIPQVQLAIQVCYELYQTPDTLEREVRALVKFDKFISCRKRLILTYSEEANLVKDGVEIQIYPVWKWLTDKTL